MSQAGKEKKPKAKTWERHEIFALCQFVKGNDQDLFGSGGKGAMGVERKKMEAWERCRVAVIAAGGHPTRTWDKYRKKWQDLASNAKKYKTNRNNYLKGTGGGEFVAPDEKHEWVLDALPATLTDGIFPAGETETVRSNDSTSNAPGTTSSSAEKTVTMKRVHVVAATATSPNMVAGPVPPSDSSTSSRVHETVPVPYSGSQVEKISRTSRKRIVIDTETEEESQEDEGNRRKKPKKKAKKTTDEVDLLTLNRTVANNEDKKVGILEGILETLQGIHGCLQRLVPPPPTALDLLNEMQPEQ